MLDLYKNIKSLRKSNNMTQEELAKKAGYNDRSAIARIESGGIDLPQSKIATFANIFGVSMADLFGSVDTEIEALTESEKAHITKYRYITPDGRERVDSLLDTEYRQERDRQTALKKISSAS